MVDPASTTLGRMLTEEITPVVMVLRTPLVEAACQKKHGVSLVQLLSRFSSFDNIDVPVRTASDQAYRLRKFKLRLFYSSDIQKPDFEAAKERLKKVITEAEDKNTDLRSELPNVEDLLPTFKSKVLPPWFEVFNKELLRISSFADHEAFDHPVACLLVVSSKDENPINKFVDLFNTNQLPAILNDGVMDPKIPKHYLLLHDYQDGMRLFMQDLSTKRIIPHMEQKIRTLNEQVSATRKGFRNQIKNLWWRKGKDDVPDKHDGPVYTYSSNESQIRLLADYAFMLRDYELALSNYRLISMDYKLDKAWKCYAGVQEMLGLTYFLLDQSRKEAEYCLEDALNTYLRLGSQGQQNATRCGVWWAEMLKARDEYKEAATVFFRVSGEEPLQSAVMLEQASYCYLFSVPSMFRKYGFHLVLSGNSYEKCGQVNHGIRTYRRALSVFKGTKWGLIRDHIHFQLGRWFASLGEFDVAMGHMLEILACGHQSQATQELFLRDFLAVVEKRGKALEVWKLQLPVIKLPSLRVVFEDHRTYGSPAAVGLRETLWLPFEEDVIPSLSGARSNWLEVQTKLVSRKHRDANICVAGEAIKVNIGFKNPLQIPISVSNVRLLCQLTAMKAEKSDTADLSHATDEQREEELRKLIALDEHDGKDSSLIMSEVDFSLNGGETLVVQLTVTPKAEGILRIVGVRWKLSSRVVGFQHFEVNQAINKSAKGRTKLKNSHFSNHLSFSVIKSLPRVDGVIRNFPKKSYHGELQKLVLELRNPSDIPVKKLKMKIGHPRFLLVSNPDVLDSEVSGGISKEHDEGSYDGGETPAVFHFPEDLVIQGDKPVLWPIWLRAAAPGPISLYMVVYYEVDEASSIMRYRILRLCYNLEVLPSIDVSFKISRCLSSLDEVIIRVDVADKTSTGSFQIHQLSAVGSQWQLTMLHPSGTPSSYIISGQALSCFFKLKNLGKKGTSVSRNFVELSTGSDNKCLLDTFNSPVTGFHYQERRLHQRRLNQEQLDAVDFILFAQSLENKDEQVGSTNPILWTMNGPRTIRHDFTTSFCEIYLWITIHNSLDSRLSVHVSTHDSGTVTNTSTSQPNDQAVVSSDNKTGWHDVSLANDIKLSSDILGARVLKQASPESVSPFIWSGSISTKLEMEPMSTIEVPLQLCVFTPGIYDISNYQLSWSVLASEVQGPGARIPSSGTCPGSSFYITVLQSA
ncbi:Trafficking protein particle complex subunit 8-like protein [Drosera capensis]